MIIIDRLLRKIKLFRRGEFMQISLTMRCSLDCVYCCQGFVLGHKPIVKEVGFIPWARFFLRFPYKIKEVYVSGGEPTLHKDFVRIVEFLLLRGYYVKVFTNLKDITKIMQLPKCLRLSIASTYHHKMPMVHFHNNYKQVKGKFHITVNELELPQRLSYSKMIRKYTADDYGEDLFRIAGLRISPNLHINMNCYELTTHTEKN